jgi:MFS family permease
VRLLFVTRSIRMFAYGFLSVLLALYLAQLGFSDARIGLLLPLTLVGDIGVSLRLTTAADRFGRRRTLAIGAALMLLAEIAFALTRNFLLLLAATIGVISPSGNEVGPFLSVEQAGLSQVVPDARRRHFFGWHNPAGSMATALGALISGAGVQALRNAGAPAVARSVGAAVSPSLSTILLASRTLMAAPFFIGGGLKIVYDLLPYRGLARSKPAG